MVHNPSRNLSEIDGTEASWGAVARESGAPK